VQAQILRLLQDVQRERGMSILLITHDLGVVAAMADAVAVMYAGRVVEYGDADDIFERPAHPYTQGLLAMTPDISEGRLKFPPRLKEIRGFVPRPEDLPPGCSFAPRCPVATDACRAAVPPLVALEGGARLAACIKAGAMAA
jgi:oligopeptide/dipeptide ABC transporter ATP-binding protein